MEPLGAWNSNLSPPDGSRIIAHALGQVEIDNGRAVRMFGSFQDISDRKRAEEERRLLDNQIREMQRVESIGILAGGMAKNDFNNLLTGILGFSRNGYLSRHLQQIEQCSVRRRYSQAVVGICPAKGSLSSKQSASRNWWPNTGQTGRNHSR